MRKRVERSGRAKWRKKWEVATALGEEGLISLFDLLTGLKEKLL